MKTTRFPFQYMNFPSKNGSEMPFIKQVESVLGEDLQKSNIFGCKINNCHTHAGSKIHFNDFVEAELLFHNSYYNRSFAKLTFDWIRSCYIEEQREKYKGILLVGYEKYSELYLQELNDLLKERLGVKCGYCVYETVAETQPDGSRKNKIELRNFQKYCNEQIILRCVANTVDQSVSTDGATELDVFDIKHTLCIFIVPINTTLSTMDKMVAKFCQNVLLSGVEESEFDKIEREHICLITLRNDSSGDSENTNDYWEFNSSNNDWLIPKNGRFEHLTNNQKIRNLVAIPSVWSQARKCKKCYPSSVVTEEPMFGVNRGSVVPMLRVGTTKILTPIDTAKNEKSIENLLKVCTLSDCLLYNHTSRGENHYQYYLNTDKLIKSNRNNIETYLDTIKKDKVFNEADDVQIFDFLVAPRHESNAEWVHLVHKRVFNGAARIIYFDVEKEYRSNLKAKYSDLICGLMNIKESNQKFSIRFHFVDDTIQSGANFLRAKNLITSLSNGSENVNIFESAFILINRLSLDTRKFYLEDVNKFFYYIDVNISPMRSYEDACTLCKLIADYHNIRNQCATNKMAEVCTRVISRHSLLPFSNQQMSNVDTTWSSQEKKLVFFITHLLNERLSNNLVLEEIERPLSIETERNSVEIEGLLFLYFNNGDRIISKYTSFSGIETLIWKVAFIKAISRPFFIYHIRQRQAAFAFCIKTLNDLLITDKNIDNCVLVQTLVKALADLNANYLIRCEVLKNLISYSIAGDTYSKDIQAYVTEQTQKFYKKRLFRTESLLHYIKKDVVLSRDTTKSLLLEHILINNNETGFFYPERQIKSINIDDFLADNSLTVKGLLYLENNVILKSGLSDNEAGNNLQKLLKSIKGDDYLYFFSNLNDIWKLNTGKALKLASDVLIKYDSLATAIKQFSGEGHEKRKDLSKLIDDLFYSINGDSKSKLQTIAFVYDNQEPNPLFQFFTLSGNPADGTEILDKCKFGNLKTSQAFFYDKNLEEIRSKLEVANRQNLDIFFMEDHLTTNDLNSLEEIPKTLIVRFGTNKILEESVYLQIWGFDKKNIKHWFSLKLLLTLRENFVQLIDKVNLQELVEERKIDAQKVALAIKKATTHAQCDKYYKLDFLHENNSNAEQFYKYYIEKDDKATKVLPILYDKYIQLLSDDFLASIYKKIINNQDCFNKSLAELGVLAKKLDNVWFGNAKPNCKDDVEYISDLFAPHMLANKKINITLYRGNTIENVEFDVSIKLNIPKDDWDKCAILCWNGEISSDLSLVVLFVLMIVNAAEHGSGDAIEIVIANDGISFVNKMRPGLTGTCKEIEKQIEKNYSIPPWVMQDQHLTLWTLYHAKNIIVGGNDECITPKIEVVQNDEYLIYKIKINIVRNI